MRGYLILKKSFVRWSMKTPKLLRRNLEGRTRCIVVGIIENRKNSIRSNRGGKVEDRAIPAKILWKKLRICLVDMFYNITFAPAIERTTMVAKAIFEDIYIIRQVVQESESSISIKSTVNLDDLGLRWRDGIRAEDIRKQFQQRRVWSWLRMNASDRLNTCKSRGSTV